MALLFRTTWNSRTSLADGRWSYSTYPPSFQSELFYTDSEKRPEDRIHRTPFCPTPRPRWGLFHSSHQRAQDFDYSDKADGERDNGDGELLTDHLGLDIFLALAQCAVQKQCGT